MSNPTMSRCRAFEESDDIPRSREENPTIGDVIAARFGRRDIMKGALAATAIATLIGPLGLAGGRGARAATSSFAFEEIEAGVDETHHVAPGHRAQVLLRWGDPVLADAPEFDPYNQTAEAQAKQFGYNNDYVGFFPLEGSSEHGLLAINHEFTNEELMFPGMVRQDTKEEAFARMTPELVAIEMAAHGCTIVEVRRGAEAWEVVRDSPYNRRLTAETPMTISGPAAGHARMRTSYDPEGRMVRGTINNCAGGKTPWGTFLTAEENFHGYFWGELADDHPERANHERYDVPGRWYAWGKYHDRFDVSKEPNEANRFGWIVEIDPYDPQSTPVKRTALGRMKHENASPIVSRDGRIAIYMGDDQRFEYIYRFVTARPWNPDDREANRDLLDEGTLSVARFNADGSLDWLPLVFGEGPLTPENGFESQADVVIEARRAADLLGATRMDRPEEVEPNPKTGKIYAMLTNNTRRKADQVDAANPRPENAFGHVIEMTPPDGDHSADRYTWEILVQCGDPSVAEVGATFNPATSRDGWFGMPDNCAFDSLGRLWIATDGNSGKATGRSDGLWAMETEGELRGTSRLFFRCPAGAEMCGPEFTPDDRALFLAVQHPADDGEDWPAFGRPSTFDDPSTRWPDFQPGVPPRPSVVVVEREDRRPIAR
jgi:secreted PhoX family phosphatase